MAVARLTPGSVFAREFRVVRRLAEGGMGAVYVVEQQSTSELRALKVMSPRLLDDARSWQRFDQEARVAARIRSDHVVRVIGAGVDADSGIPWLCMELLHGRDLGAVLAARGPLPPAEVAVLFEQLCHALEQAHAAGIVHRDLKPENLFVAEAQSPGVPFVLKILDFGIARMSEDARRTSILTEGLGTPMWMAPEQCEASSAIGPPTDVWALGLIAFALLTCRAYWVRANDTQLAIGPILEEMLQGPIAPPSRRAAELGVGARVPPGFDAWFLRCVARDPAARFAHAGEARDALRPVLAAATRNDRIAPATTAPSAAPTEALTAAATTRLATTSAATTPDAAPHALAPGIAAAATDAPTSRAAVPAIGAPHVPPTRAPRRAGLVVAAVLALAAAGLALVATAALWLTGSAATRGEDGANAVVARPSTGAVPSPPAVLARPPGVAVPPLPVVVAPSITYCESNACDPRLVCQLEARVDPTASPIPYGEATYVRAVVADGLTSIVCGWERHGAMLVVQLPAGTTPGLMQGPRLPSVSVGSHHVAVPVFPWLARASAGSVNVTEIEPRLAGAVALTFDVTLRAPGAARREVTFRGLIHARVLTVR